MKILVIDVGGTHVKMMVSGEQKARKFRSRASLTAKQMVRNVLQKTRDWSYSVVAIGYPGPVLRGKPVQNPKNLGSGWVGFDYARAFDRPVKIMNDAAMQALGSYEGGRMLFLGLGTSVGSALIVNRVVIQLELGHLVHSAGKTIEAQLGRRGLKRLGARAWRRAVQDVIDPLKQAFMVDYVVLGGGNAKKLRDMPPETRLGDNRNAFIGGCRLWQPKWHGPNIPVHQDGHRRPSSRHPTLPLMRSG
jgi:polyphosphate glucokinase